MLKWVNQLCPPARLYFVFSIALMIASIIQNLFGIGTTQRIGYGKHRMCVGVYDCRSSVHPLIHFAVQLAYILLWSWVLNQICKSGYVNIAWFILFLPLLLFFSILGMFIVMVMFGRL